jgi:Ser/Thr protein kinase RdoA (MazF antagonist)
VRKRDVDLGALERLTHRVFRRAVTVQRTPNGVSAQVYRLSADSAVWFLRVAEEPDEDLSTDAALLHHLRTQGARVPEPIHVEFEPVIGRSVMITSAIPGQPVAECQDPQVAASVVRAAARDLAIINEVPVDGFGFIRRQAPAWPLRAKYREFAQLVTSYLPNPWPGQFATLFNRKQLDALEELVTSETERPITRAHLAHGDFDTTPIFAADDRYTGLIDFGEIRGTELHFDLGHFYLHDEESVPTPLVHDLLAGYQEVTPLSDNDRERIRRAAILLGLRQLSRWLGPPVRFGPTHALALSRAARLKALLNGDGISWQVGVAGR